MGLRLGPFGPKEGPKVPCLGAMGIRWNPMGPKPWVARDINKVFAKVSKNICKVKIEKVWH